MLYSDPKKFSIMRDVVAPYFGVLIAIVVFVEIARCVP